MTVNLLTYKSIGGTCENPGIYRGVNLFQGLSALNRKYHPMVSDDGQALGVLCDITVDIGSPGLAQIYTVPNSWVFRNAVRRFHFEHRKMMENAGVSIEELGPYARNLSFKFDNTDVELITCDLFQLHNPENLLPPFVLPGFDTNPRMEIVKMGQWNYSDFASVPKSIDSSGAGIVEEAADRWSIHICGPSVIESTSLGGDEKYTSVGMMDAYLKSRRDYVRPDAADVIDIANNPLLSLTSQTATAGEVVEIAGQEMIIAPPYDEGEGTASQRTRLTEIEVQGSQTLKQTLRNVFVPAGWLQFSQNIGTATVKVHGVLECREYTL